MSFQGVSRVRSSRNYLNWEIYIQIVMGFIMIFTATFSHGYTNPEDVFAINNLFVALANPPLPGWIPNGGDPCTEAWQGVQCVGSNITGIIINAANLGGELGNNLQYFSSITALDLSNNNIGGSIPSNLPVTLKNFFLSANQFMGSIPVSLSSLTQLTDINYAVQYVLEIKIPSATTNFISQFERKYVHLSMQKFSSNVVEKCLNLFSEWNRSRLIYELLLAYEFEQLLQDPLANYVIQTDLDVSKGPLRA